MFIIQIPFLDLQQTYDSGQHLRWVKVGENKFVVIHKDKVVKVSQNKDKFCFSCTEEEFYDVWYDYFDICSDYLSYNYKIKSIDDNYIKSASIKASGIRIIRQDLYEVIISSIIDYFYDGDIEATDITIRDICRIAGKKKQNTIRDAGKLTWYQFPNPDDIIRRKEKLKLATNLTDKQVWLLVCVCEYIREYGFVNLPTHLRDLGFGNHLFICINLYGFHKLRYMVIDDSVVEAIVDDIGCEDVDDFFYWFVCNGVENICGLLSRYIYYRKVYCNGGKKYTRYRLQ